MTSKWNIQYKRVGWVGGAKQCCRLEWILAVASRKFSHSFLTAFIAVFSIETGLIINWRAWPIRRYYPNLLENPKKKKPTQIYSGLSRTDKHDTRPRAFTSGISRLKINYLYWLAHKPPTFYEGILFPYLNACFCNLPSFERDYYIDVKGKGHPQLCHSRHRSGNRITGLRLTSALEAGAWLAPRLGRFTPRKDSRYPL